MNIACWTTKLAKVLECHPKTFETQSNGRECMIDKKRGNDIVRNKETEETTFEAGTQTAE
jgi:hypothetical protein